MKQVTKGKWNGYDTYILHSHELEVTVLPRLGNNVIAIWDKIKERHVVRPPDEQDLAFYLQKPYHFGVPLLIPPGRIRKGHFNYEGVDYQFVQNTANDNHIHGLHRTQAWCVSDIEEDEDGCSITTELLTADDPHWMEQYPAPLRLELTFSLHGTALEHRLRVTHLGDRPAPFGLGFHTWFLLDGEPQNWTLKLPVAGLYEQDEQQLPTGELAPLGEYEALQSGMNMQGRNWDTLLRAGEGTAAAHLTRNDGYGVIYTVDQAFKHWVLFTKGESDQFLCIEPYTWLSDAPNLPQDDAFTGLIRLIPEETVELNTRIEVVYPE
ncbi:aldose 1-epimerase [Paenibacillus sp. JX-17]|uniref:Aldose 1-epimerase n=1 Tax=Paenibacillus lacisoli TaxID=3064525 RepID=A0ABT9CEM7_9BACL|nr:aldose 1-epimerase [Paenibacillus sp. JX-17]MDO7907089.1 aldose 1-epimerase [Paenibacillus sp. JX-17]